MDYIYPALDNTSSLFPSPVQSPVPYGGSLDFWADWPAVSDINTSGKGHSEDIIYHNTFSWRNYVLMLSLCLDSVKKNYGSCLESNCRTLVASRYTD